MNPQPDREERLRQMVIWASVFIAPDQQTEIRAWDAEGQMIASAYRVGLITGPIAMAKLALELEGRQATAYFTPHLAAEQPPNRRRSLGKTDMAEYRWLLVDIDPKRPAKLSATDAEKERAREVAEKCRLFLHDRGFRGVLFGDSGNGHNLPVPVAFPANEENQARVKRFLEILQSECGDAEAGTEDGEIVTPRASVDLATHNPDRLWKVPGILAQSKEATAERPHRYSALLEFEVPTAEVRDHNNARLEALLLEFPGKPAAKRPRPVAASEAPYVDPAALNPRARKYVESGINDALAELRKAGSGSLNVTLFKAAAAVGNFVGCGAVGYADAEGRLREAAEAAGCNDPRKDEDTLHRGLHRGIETPRDLTDKLRKPARVTFGLNGHAKPDAANGEVATDPDEVECAETTNAPDDDTAARFVVNEAGEVIDIGEPKADDDHEATADGDLASRVFAAVTESEAALLRDRDLLGELTELRVHYAPEWLALRSELKGKVSLSSLDKALDSVQRSARAEAQAEGDLYTVKNGAIYFADLHGPLALTDFNARIAEEISKDDGSDNEPTLAFILEGTDRDGRKLPAIGLKASEYDKMAWVGERWGARATLMAGRFVRDHARTGIQLLSGTPPRHTVYTHLGWRKRDGELIYLHAGGAIGINGPVAGVEVMPGNTALAGYVLPTPPIGDQIKPAIRASLRLLGVGPLRLTIPGLAAVFRSILGEPGLSLHLTGATGGRKTTLAALLQAHFGAGFNGDSLPANWSSTANALEEISFLAKDVILTVDEYVPSAQASGGPLQRYNATIDRLFRSTANHSGRQRMRKDMTTEAARPPRGLIVSTGEDLPGGQSARARVLIVEVSDGDLGKRNEPCPALDACQRDAAAGMYAQTTSAFVQWLAPRLGEMRKTLGDEIADFRKQLFTDGGHPRTPGLVASLAVGFRVFLDFAEAAGAIDAAERKRLWDSAWAVFIEATKAQGRYSEDAEPTVMFQSLLLSALTAGKAHVTDRQGGAPANATAWGWRSEEYFPSGGTSGSVKPCGDQIGWVDGADLYLEPGTSLAVAQAAARGQSKTFHITDYTLKKTLSDKGLLVAIGIGSEKGRFTVRPMLQGAQRRVLHLNASWLNGIERLTQVIPDEDLDDADPMKPSNLRSAAPSSIFRMTTT